ncbi:nucleopolyhedrovirus P10 family protein [Streptomyces sp. NBC_00140]|uniref:nucleopolyhedrovirus P10 family protein n=1 Tax=Streptomyces sp. NBC_00140 TaxID=2975664 RepID=UPI0022543905|nr:nucleopolyhedrovirus P10 family protein [Streptomyces sp. NBC_00140]MCX5335147.1 nucleopolyhedrovirus P10 family protein [Streptomyces sp. NBC_00140]
MTADRWAQTVRHQLGLGRLLPLGGAHDGAWIAEEAAEAVLRRAVRELRGVRLDRLRISLADPEDVHDPVVPPPPSALPPGPLRVTAEFAATADEPLPATAALLRTALATAATERLGLTVTEVDLQVTSLLDEVPEAGPVRRPEPASAEPAGDPAAAAALSVPGVTGLTAALGRAVQVEERQGETALPRRHVRVEVAVDAERRAVDVARAVRREVGKALPGHPTVAVLVTAVG